METLILGAILTVITTFMGWLSLRSVKGIDDALKTLSGEVKQLSTQDTKILVEIADLRARVVHLEMMVRQ